MPWCDERYRFAQPYPPSGARYKQPAATGRRVVRADTDNDLERLKSQPDWPFHEIVQMIAERAEQNGKTLIIGDWSNLDFVADKSIAELSGIFLHPTALEARFEPTLVAIVRHPVDQWIHLQNKLGPEAPSLEIFMRGYRRFSDCLEGIETIRLEDFLADPGAVLTTICDRLDAPYNPNWESGWKQYQTFIGEPFHQKAGNAVEIELNDDILKAFTDNPNYAPGIERLGYVEVA
jgi:hypothetical protein